MRTSTCQQCHISFSVGPGSLGKFCSKSCSAKFGNALRRLNTPPKLPTESCLQCSSAIFKPNKFCNHSCAAIFNSKLRPSGHPSRISLNSNRGKNQKPKLYSKISWCSVCNTIIKGSHRVTCSDKCLQNRFQFGGKKSASQQIRRSKDEIVLYNLCKDYFKSVRHNQSLINGWDADIIIDDIKAAILWNGPWHYQSMPHKNHSLLQVQTRDKIKYDQLTSIGWKVLVFEDRHYTPKSAFETIVMVAGQGNAPCS